MKNLFVFLVVCMVSLFVVHPAFAIDPSLIIQKTINITIPTSTPTPTPKLDISNIKLNVTIVALPSSTLAPTPKASVTQGITPTIALTPSSETTTNTGLITPTAQPSPSTTPAVRQGLTTRETILFGVVIALFLIVVVPIVWTYLKKLFTKKA